MTGAMKWVMGVDGCPSGWFVVAVGLQETAIGAIECAVCETFADVLKVAQAKRVTVIAVDIPIGLLDEWRTGGRECDRQARAQLGRRGCTVFSPPIRAQLEDATHEAAKELAPMTIQAFCILPKIREVDAALATERSEFVYEVHP